LATIGLVESLPALSWSVHRARETPVRTAVVSFFIIVFLVFSLLVFGPLLALLAAVILFVALNSYFLPVTITFSDQGLVIDKRLYRARYEWKQFRRWFRTSGGIVLSPFSRRTYLDNFRGVHLLLPADPSAIIAYLDARFAPPPANNRLRLNDEARMTNDESSPKREG
jgi:hypothetical protein